MQTSVQPTAASLRVEIATLATAKFYGMSNIVIKAINSGIKVKILVHAHESIMAKIYVEKLVETIQPPNPDAEKLIETLDTSTYGHSGYYAGSLVIPFAELR